MRLILVMLAVLAGAAWVQIACAPMDRYVALSMIFDDVPRPGTTPAVGYAVPFPHLVDADDFR